MYEVVDGVDASLVGGDEHAHDPALCFSTAVCPVVAVDLAVDDGWSDRCFTAPVRGVDAVGGEVGEQRVDLDAEVFDEFAVLVVGVGVVAEQLDTFTQIGSDLQASLGGCCPTRWMRMVASSGVSMTETVWWSSSVSLSTRSGASKQT